MYKFKLSLLILMRLFYQNKWSKSALSIWQKIWFERVSKFAASILFCSLWSKYIFNLRYTRYFLFHISPLTRLENNELMSLAEKVARSFESRCYKKINYLCTYKTIPPLPEKYLYAHEYKIFWLLISIISKKLAANGVRKIREIAAVLD